MNLMIALLERHKHPLTWLYSLLFYINLFVGLWLHHWLLILTSVTGVIAVTFFQPASKRVPAWADRFMAIAAKQWLALSGLTQIAVMFFSLLLLIVLMMGLWQNSVFITASSLIVLILVKAYFLQEPILHAFNICSEKCQSLSRSFNGDKKDKK